MTISRSENAQFSNTFAFGQSLSRSSGGNSCNNNNHCIDRNTAKQYEVGQILENNGESTTSSTDREGSSSSHTAGGSVGGSFMGIGASAEYSYSSSKTQEKEQTKSSSSGWRNSNSNSETNSHSINTNYCDSTENCRTDSIGADTDYKTDETIGGDKGSTISFSLPGKKDTIENSKDITKAKEVITTYSGSIAVSDMECQTYKANVKKEEHFPAFTETFKTEVQKLHHLSVDLSPFRLIVKKQGKHRFYTTLNITTEEEFDKQFSKFIINFGTHYIHEATFGGKMFFKSSLKNYDQETLANENEKDCLEIIHQKEMQKYAFGKEGRENCNDEDSQKKIESSLKIEDTEYFSKGAPVADIKDVSEWSKSEFPNPDITDFKLEPIMSLFDKEIMSSKRLTDNYGNSIAIDLITSWMLPRYVILLNRCKDLTNHKVSEDGSSCIPCQDNLVPSENGLKCESKWLLLISNSFKVFLYIRSTSME